MGPDAYSLLCYAVQCYDKVIAIDIANMCLQDKQTCPCPEELTVWLPTEGQKGGARVKTKMKGEENIKIMLHF